MKLFFLCAQRIKGAKIKGTLKVKGIKEICQEIHVLLDKEKLITVLVNIEIKNESFVLKSL